MANEKFLNKGIEVSMGALHGKVYGGRFYDYRETRRLVGVKMAEEIDHPHDFKVDTEDFSTPLVKDMQDGLIFGLKSIAEGKDVYTGCMGGIGRTGLYMACMAKVMHAYYLKKGECLPDESLVDPVFYVRKWYNPHAVETAGQKKYVQDFDCTPVLGWITHYELRMNPAPITVYVDRVITQSPLEWAKDSLRKVFVKP
jgi:hypothetical protein